MNTAAVQEERGPRIRSSHANTLSNSRHSNITWKSPVDSSSIFYTRFNSTDTYPTYFKNPTLNNTLMKTIHEPETRNIIPFPALSHQIQSTRIIPSGTAIQYEISAQIFLAAVQNARRHRDFSMLDLEEQNKILLRGWPALFILRAAMWPIDIINIRGQSSASNNGALVYLTAARTAIAKLQLDDIELCILDTIALCRPEITNTIDSHRIISRARDNAAQALIRHHQHRNDHNKLVKILFVLPILTGCCPWELAEELFAPIIDEADLERVIASVR